MPLLQYTETSEMKPHSPGQVPIAKSFTTLHNPTTSKKSTIIIFDWDDTLLASTHLSSNGYRLDTDLATLPIDCEILCSLAELDQSVCILLNTALRYGEVHIITNAENGWVQLSAAKFLPNVALILPRVRVLSARSTYESNYPESPMRWKYYAFQERLSSVMRDMYLERNIISLGDSHVEREAVRAVTRGHSFTKTKSVKFAERPSAEQLRRQIELVIQCFSFIHSHDGDLDLQLTVTVNAPPPSTSTPAPTTSPNILATEARDSVNDEDMSCSGEVGDESSDHSTSESILIPSSQAHAITQKA